jgi:hypothetical protein
MVFLFLKHMAELFYVAWEQSCFCYNNETKAVHFTMCPHCYKFSADNRTILQ